MWIEIDGKKRSFKSINFTLLREELLEGFKTQTARTNFIPYYKCNKELIAFTFKKTEVLFLCPIKEYYPRLIFDFTLEEAKRDGFDSIEEFQDKLMEINNIKHYDHWTFIILWDKDKRIFPKDFSENKTLEEWL